MTSGNGQMRQIYPVAGEPYRYRLADVEGVFDFEVEDGASMGQPATLTMSIESRQAGEGLCRTAAGRTCPFAWAWVGPELHLWLDGDLFVFEKVETLRRGGAATGEASGDILAPMPGAVLEVLVEEGQRVERNQTVLLLESMKMELAITAPRSGVVARIAVQPGQRVERGMRLAEVGEEG